ncbi:hypothetical protein FOG50_02547 [Hanseniaspora uvarum]|nr:hypothetical protein FOG50_02547 [Hanseniaspora uvarum]
MTNHHKVIIIGAGISGLKAANLLINEHSITDIKIIEARDRYGGRLLSSDPGYHKQEYDLGASWHHDILINTVFQEERKTPYRPYVIEDDDFALVDYESEERLDKSKELNIMPIFNELNTFLKLNLFDNLNNKMSLKDAVLMYISKMSDTLTKQQKVTLLGLSRYSELWNGDSWNLISAEDCIGDHYGRNALVNNFGLYPNKYLEQNDLKQKIQLSTAVNSVDVVIEEGKKIVKITTDKNEIFTADYLICSIPLSLLKKSSENSKQVGSISFNPPLSHSFTDALSKISFGSLGKFFFEFDSIKWSTDQSRAIQLSKNYVQTVNELENFDLDGEFLTAEHFSKLSSETEEPKEYKCEDYPYFVLNLAKSFKLPTLLFLTQYPLTEHLEQLTNEELYEFFKPALANSLKKIFNCDKTLKFSPDGEDSVSDNEIHLKNIVHTSWTKDPFALGAYTSVRVNDSFDPFLEESLKGHEDIIRFVGEAYIAEGNGCVWGAEETAKREIKKIMEIETANKVGSLKI